MMERVEPAGRGERKMGLRWRLICEGRLVWFVLAESKGGGCSDVLPKRRRKERCSSREACLQSAVGRSKKRIRPPFLP
jgi:hypothetical protein